MVMHVLLPELGRWVTAGQAYGFVSAARAGVHLLQTWTAHCCSPAVNVDMFHFVEKNKLSLLSLAPTDLDPENVMTINTRS